MVIDLIVHHKDILQRPVLIYSANMNDYLRAYCSPSNQSRSLETYKEAFRDVSDHSHKPSISLPLDLQVAEFAEWAVQNECFKTISVCPSEMLAFLEKLHEIGNGTVAKSILAQHKYYLETRHLKFFVSARLWLRLPVNLPKSFIHKRVFRESINVTRNNLPGILKYYFPTRRPSNMSNDFVDVLGHLIFKSIVKNDGYVLGDNMNRFHLESLFGYILRNRKNVKVVGKLAKIFAWLEPIVASMDISTYRNLMMRLAKLKATD